MLCLHAMDTLFFCTIIKRWQLFESIPQLQIDVWHMSCIRRCKLNQTDVFALSGLIVQAFLSSVFLFILFNGSDLVLVNSSQYSSLFTLVYVSRSCVFIQSAVLVLASSKKQKWRRVVLVLVNLYISDLAHASNPILFTLGLIFPIPQASLRSLLSLCFSQANRNCLVMASTHDIQELDVSSILATQILTWIDDDEAEAKG